MQKLPEKMSRQKTDLKLLSKYTRFKLKRQ